MFISPRLLNRKKWSNPPAEYQDQITSNPHFIPATVDVEDVHERVKSGQGRKIHKKSSVLQKKNRYSVIIIGSFFLLIVRIIYGTIHKHYTTTFHKTQKKQQIATIPLNQAIPYNQVECGGRHDGGGFTIPHQLLFTYRNNMLETKEPAVLYKNILNTIDIYSTLWKQNKTEVDVMFLDDQACLDIIHTVEPRLIDPFLYEPTGAYAADICRAAALYCHGGYYFDLDIQVLKALDPDPHIDFITAKDGSDDGTGFFQAVLAASPLHPVMKYTFDSMVNDWYYNPAVIQKFQSKSFNPKRLYSQENLKILKQSIGSDLMGPGTLYKGYQKYDKKDTSWLLREYLNAKDDEKNGLYYTAGKYKDLFRANRTYLCNFIVEDEETSTPYFYSRIVGVFYCPLSDPVSKKKSE